MYQFVLRNSVIQSIYYNAPNYHSDNNVIPPPPFTRATEKLSEIGNIMQHQLYK